MQTAALGPDFSKSVLSDPLWHPQTYWTWSYRNCQWSKTWITQVLGRQWSMH